MIAEIILGITRLARDLLELALSGEQDPAKLRSAVQGRLTDALAWSSGLSAIHAADWDPTK